MSVQLQRRQRTFVDISLAFEPNPTTGDVTLLLNERAINNSLKNLILFGPQEVPFNRDIGSHTRHYLFDLVDEGTAGLLKIEIERAIKFGEPRVKIQHVKVEPQLDRNYFMVTITYKIVGYDQIFTVNQILKPTR